MSKSLALAVLATAFTLSAQTRPDWAFLTPDKQQPPSSEESGPIHIPGSSKEYTAAQIDDLSNPPVWFPDETTSAPPSVLHGKGAALACGACHLMSGHGHQESADLAGLSADYIVRTMQDFKSGARIDPARMNAIAKGMSDDDIRQAAEYFAALKPGGWIKVVETDRVPKSYVSVKGRQRLPLPEGGMEPLGDRIIELPEDVGQGFRISEDRRRGQKHRLRDLSRRLAGRPGRRSPHRRPASGVCRASALCISNRHQPQRVIGADEEGGRESDRR
ncbi:MAG: hypothetical protein ABSE57_07280 [Bryobacteraceae bacterium]